MNTYTFENLSSFAINEKETNGIKSITGTTQKAKVNNMYNVDWLNNINISNNGKIFDIEESIKLFTILKHTKKLRTKKKLYNRISQTFIGHIYLYLMLGDRQYN